MSRYVLPRAFILLLMTASGLACTVEGNFDRTRYRCDGDSRCPSDQVCVSGYCEPEAGGNLPSEPGCGTINLLRDDFDGPERNELLWRQPVEYFTSVYQNEGSLVMDIGVEDGNAHGRYESERRYLFRSGSVAVELAQYESETTTQAKLELEVDGANQASIRVRGDELLGRVRIHDQDHDLAEIPYDENAHRWLRLRESDGVMYWETSGDGQSWEVQISTASAPFATMVTVELEARMYELEDAPVQIRFDNLNTTLAVEEAWCPASTLADDFDDGLLGPQWGKWEDDGCDAFERDGRIVFEHHATTLGSCGYYTQALYDLTGSSVAVEVPPAAGAGISTTLSAWAETDEYIELKQEEGQIRCFSHIGNNSVQACAISYDPIMHRWWRLRHEDSLLYWETSADGQTWDEAAKHERGEMPIHEITIGLWTESWDIGEDIESVPNGFDNLNLAGE